MSKDNVPETLRDLDQALRIAGGSRDLADELFAQFCGELPARMAAISEFAAVGDYERMRDALHQLKGGAAVCAVKPFTEALEDVHQAAKSAQHVGVKPLLAILQARADALLDSTDR